MDGNREIGFDVPLVDPGRNRLREAGRDGLIPGNAGDRCCTFDAFRELLVQRGDGLCPGRVVDLGAIVIRMVV